MSSGTWVKSWPATLLAIDWSHDGIIALAADTHVELLFPNTQSQDQEQDVLQWLHFTLQVPWFSEMELPKREPAPLKSYSVGEEISTSSPQQIAWSPPGIGKHRTCALAVLTSNLVLSIWAPDGKLQDSGRWDRRLMINDVLSSFTSSKGEEPLDSHVQELSRLQKRVRTFAWAPSLSNLAGSGIVGTQLSWGIFIIAVANDDGKVLLVQIDSPTSTFTADTDWNARSLGQFTLESDNDSPTSTSRTFNEIMGRPQHVASIAWSPWVFDGLDAYSVITYATNSDVRARGVTYSHGKITIGTEIMVANEALRYSGPMTWSPNSAGQGQMLALFTVTEIVVLKVSIKDTMILERRSHRIEDRWDTISGVVWDTLDDSTVRLHFSRQTTTTRGSTVVLEVSPTEIKSISGEEWPHWREQISGSQGYFSANNELKGHANARVWGLSASPLGDFIAACHTLHPTDMIEYGVANERHTNIAVTRMREMATTLVFPNKAVSAESIFDTTRKWLNSNMESTDDLSPFKVELCDKLMTTYRPQESCTTTSGFVRQAYKPEDLDEAVTTFKCNAILNAHSLKDRYEILASRICTPTETNELSKTLIAFRLAQEVQSLPEELYVDHSFSVAIVQAHQQLSWLVEDVLQEPDGKAATIQAATSTETCSFCDEGIPFSNPFSAVCRNGHQFVRCGLSFLTIQEPGITKHCGLCKMSFFSDTHVFEECIRDQRGMSSTSEHDLPASEGMILHGVGREDEADSSQRLATETQDMPEPLTLAKLLFMASDVCIYCGGKYVG